MVRGCPRCCVSHRTLRRLRHRETATERFRGDDTQCDQFERWVAFHVNGGRDDTGLYRTIGDHTVLNKWERTGLRPYEHTGPDRSSNHTELHPNHRAGDHTEPHRSKRDHTRPHRTTLKHTVPHGPPGTTGDHRGPLTGTAASHDAQWEAPLMNRSPTPALSRPASNLFGPYICWPLINTPAHKTANDTSNLCACVGQLFFTVAHFLRHVAPNKDLLQRGCQFFGVIDHWQASHNAPGRRADTMRCAAPSVGF